MYITNKKGKGQNEGNVVRLFLEDSSSNTIVDKLQLITYIVR